MWGFGGGRASGVHGGTDNLGSIVADFNRQLEQSLSTLNKMVDAVGKLKDGAKGATAAIHVPGSGTTGQAKAGGAMSGYQGQVPEVPGPATGQQGKMVDPGNVSFGFLSNKMMVGLGLARVGGLAALGAGATAWAALPETADAVAMQGMLHQMGTRQNVYLGKPTQTNLLNTIMGSIDQYAVGGRDQPMMAAATFSGMGIQNQGMLRTLLSQNQGLSLMTGLPNSNVAAAQAGFSNGPMAARMLSFGMPTADIRTGDMKGTQQILETMYQRMAVRGKMPTPEGVQESYYRGALGANFRSLGLSDEQQQIALQYFTERARSNGPVNLSDIKGLQKLGYNEDNAAWMSEASKSRSQLEVMNKTFDAMADAAGDANRHLKMFYDTIADMPTDALRKFAQAKGYLDTMMSDPAAATAIGTLTGALGGLMNMLTGLASLAIVKKLLGLGGGKGTQAATTGGLKAVTGAERAAELKGLLPGASKLAKTGGALGFLVQAGIMGYENRSSYGDIVGGLKNRDAGQVLKGLKENLLYSAEHAMEAVDPAAGAKTGMDFFRSLVTGGAGALANQSITTAWHKPGSWAAGYHTGVDLSAGIGTKVMSVTSGRVVEASSGGRYGGAYGNHVVVKTGGREFLYAHLNSIGVSRGDQVREGQMVGKSGNSGRSFGPHLHFEVRKAPYNYKDDVDPVPYLKGKGALGTDSAGGASGAALVKYAKKFIGTPYVAGGRDPRGWDCAGFTWFVAKHFGIEIGQVSEAQLKKGSPVSGVKNAKPGDLFIWRKKGTRGVGADGHVAMYVGGGRVIHAHGGAGGTTNITSLGAAVPSSHYLAGIRRIAGGSPGTGPSLASKLGSGTPEANGTSSGGAVSGSLLDVTVTNAGMSVTSRTIADTMGSAAPGGAEPASLESGNGLLSRASSSDRSVGVGAKVGGKSNAAKVWNMLMAEGFGAAAAAGVIGNLQQESGVNPNSNQHGGGPGRGIMQWTVNERWASLQGWAKKRGLKARDLDTQVQFMLKEMKDYGVLGKMRGMNDVEKATLYFENTMERAGVPNMSSRYKFAREALKQFGRGSYSGGAYQIGQDEDARVHAGEMIIPADKAAEVRHAMAGVMSGGKSGGHTFNIYVPAGTTEEQANIIARRVASILDRKTATKNLMEA